MKDITAIKRTRATFEGRRLWIEAPIGESRTVQGRRRERLEALLLDRLVGPGETTALRIDDAQDGGGR